MIDFVKLGERLTKYRKDAELSQDELAKMLYVTRQAISKWERGECCPEIETLAKIGKIFAKTIDEMIFDNAHLDVDEEDIFRGHDRSYIVEKIAQGQIRVDLSSVFYQFSPKERMYILKQIKLGRIKCDREMLIPILTPPEVRFLDTPPV